MKINIIFSGIILIALAILSSFAVINSFSYISALTNDMLNGFMAAVVITISWGYPCSKVMPHLNVPGPRLFLSALFVSASIFLWRDVMGSKLYSTDSEKKLITIMLFAMGIFLFIGMAFFGELGARHLRKKENSVFSE